MSQLELFSIAPSSSIERYGISTTPQIEQALASHSPVAIGVSGGKDSSAVAIRTTEYLDKHGHRGPRLLVHCDLGEIEWEQSLPVCERLAQSLGLELLVLHRSAGGLLSRWRQRWENNKTRYRDLRCVRLIMPWSAAATRFCTSELKIAVLCQALVTRFPGQTILSVSGIRRSESASRSKAPIAAEQPRLLRKKLGTRGFDWHSIIDWSVNDVFAFLRKRNQPLHEAYTRYKSSRVSCAFCVLASAADLKAAASCVSNHAIYRVLVALEIESSFSFQPNRWLGDVAPHLLSADQQDGLERAKWIADERKRLERQIPPHLMFEAGFPTRTPTHSEAELLALVRKEVSAMFNLDARYCAPNAVLERYEDLLRMRDLSCATR